MKKIINWFKNYWYYYKWPVIVIGFFVIAIAVMVAQSASQVDYDIHILYAGPYIFQLGEKEQAEDIFRSLMPRDYNGDGEKTVILANMTIMTEEQFNEAMEASNRVQGPAIVLGQYYGPQIERAFSQEIFAGESVICLLDPSRYEQVKSQNGFLPLEEALGYNPDIAFDDYGMYLKDTAIGQYFELFRRFPEDTILCIRRLSTASVFTGKKKAEESYKYHLDYFKHLVEFKGE